MARLQQQLGSIFWVACTILLIVPPGMAVKHPHEPAELQSRNIFGDITNAISNVAEDVGNAIVNTFDTLQMCVFMPIFNDVSTFFTMTLPSAVENFAAATAQSFFMQANTLVVGGLYDLTMLTNDVANFVNTGVIDAEHSIQNFAVNVGQGIVSTEMAAGNLVTNLATQFNSDVAPSLISAFDQATDVLANVAEGDILPALEFAGNYLKTHPELIAKITLAVALLAITTVMPELAGGDAALIADVVAEAGAEGAADAVATVAADAAEEGASESFFSNTLGKVTDQLEMFQRGSNPLGMAKSSVFNFYDNVQKFLDLTDQNDTIALIETILPMSQSTITSIQNIIVPLQQSTLGVVHTYTNFDTVVNSLASSGKIMKRDEDEHMLEARNKKATSSSSSSSKTKTATKSTSTSARTSAPFGAIINSMGGFGSGSSAVSSSSTTHSTSSKSATATSSSSSPSRTSATTIITTVPLLNLTTFVQHHWLNRTKGGRTYAKIKLHSALMTHLSNFSTSNALMSSGQVPTTLTSMLPNAKYPPSSSGRALAISSQIAKGKATAYNGQNVTVKIVMDSKATMDPCLNLTVTNCHFGNQQNLPFCRNQCATRWYNVMGTTVPQY